MNPKFTKVRCFALGDEIEPFEVAETTYQDGNVVVTPLLFDTVLVRAENRLFKLYNRVKDAPFLEAHRKDLEAFLKPVESAAPDLFTDNPA